MENLMQTQSINQLISATHNIKMSNLEQQIGRQLGKAQEQEEIDHTHWLLTKNIKKGYNATNVREEDISQWVSRIQKDREEGKRPFYSLMKSNDKKKLKQQSKYLNFFNQTMTKSFYRYGNLSSMLKKQEQSISDSVSLKKLNLKLPLPSFLEQYTSNPEQIDKKATLPLIKNLIIPVNFLKNGQRRQTKDYERRLHPLIVRGNSESMYLGSQYNYSYKKGKNMGNLRRCSNGSNSLISKSSRNPLQYNKLKECITFTKS